MERQHKGSGIIYYMYIHLKKYIVRKNIIDISFPTLDIQYVQETRLGEGTLAN